MRRERKSRSPVPLVPVDIDEVMRRFPTVRQSLLASFDDCPLTTLFSLRYAQGWSTSPQARGTIFHRFAAEALRDMRRNDSETIPSGVAQAILEEVIRQHGVAPEDIVRVPLRDIPVLRMAVKKFAKDNAFTVRNIMEIEKRISHPISYQTEDGQWVERMLTGQLDALIAKPPDEAVVIDWKDTWQLPPERHEDAEEPGISYHGYFQQRFYGWLVMKEYPAVQAVTLREFYARRTKARSARITRDQLEIVEQELGWLVEAFDRAVAAGEPPKLTLEVLEAHGHWKPQPGKHCQNCVAAVRCPIEADARVEGAVTSPRLAERAAGELQVAKAVVKRLTLALAPWVEKNGPIPIKDAKGRRVFGYRQLSNGKTRLDTYTPEGADRPADRRSVPQNEEEARMVEAQREADERRRAA